jgi:GTP-binding protein
LKVLSAEFVTSAAPGGRADGIPRDGLPHIALAGRSNVGKSSLINALCRQRIARTSAAPGKTRLANVYRVRTEGGSSGTREFYLVDLPGYGYARGGPDAARELRAVAEAYFSFGQRGATRPVDAELKLRAAPRAALLLVDSRHPGFDSDVAAHAWLTATGAAPHIVATKIDKLSRSERARNLKALEEIFGTAALPVSATSGEGLNELWQLIIRLAKSR